MADGLVGPTGEPLATPADEVERLQEALFDSERERRVSEKNLEFVAYHLLNAYADDQDAPQRDRLKLVRLSREAWKRDPLAGRAVNLLNDFTFGRGAPKPKCRDEKVQEEVDKAWDDAQNKRVLTSYAAQRAVGTDLAIQSNVYLLIFDDGEDGKVKLGRLQHDTVETVVRDPENRDRILYYLARESRVEWDFNEDRPKNRDEAGKPKVRYYEHWQNVQEAEGEGDTIEKPPDDKMGEGRVYHIATNRTSEMAFGHPELHRVTRWFSAINELASSRVDVQKAAAAFLMKRRVKGSPSTVTRIAQQAISKRGELGSEQGDMPHAPPRPGSILTENEAISHEALNLNTNSGGAAQDADMLLGQASAGVGWPKGYLGGDLGSLAGATALELPTLKLVEARQELFEQCFRWFTDRVIERAVESGNVPPKLEQTELREARVRHEARRERERLREEGSLAMLVVTEAIARGWDPRATLETALAATRELRELREAYEEKTEDEAITERDLSYEWALPPALRRTLGDFITAIANIAKTFDPNGTNIELSRMLLGIALSEGLEVEDAAAAVERIFPPDYVDPAVAAFQAQQQAARPAPEAGAAGGGEEGSTGADQQRHTEENPHGAPRKATPPEEVQEATLAELPVAVAERATERGRQAATEMEQVVWGQIERELHEQQEREREEAEAAAPSNGGPGTRP